MQQQCLLYGEIFLGPTKLDCHDRQKSEETKKLITFEKQTEMIPQKECNYHKIFANYKKKKKEKQNKKTKEDVEQKIVSSQPLYRKW